MKTFVVFAAVMAVAAANAVGRSGWGSGQGHGPVINANLEGAAAAAAAGQAAAQQALAEHASGTVDAPALVLSANGVLTSVDQSEGVSQVIVADKPSGATSTIQDITVDQEAIGLDTAEASLSGGNSASFQNSANTDASGEGAIAAEGVSVNNVQTPGAGWRQ